MTLSHIPPTNIQDEPADTTSKYIATQVGAYTTTKELISTRIAQAIAAQWQSPGPRGIQFAMFASTGTVAHDLADEIMRERRQLGDDTDSRWAGEELTALLAYVRESRVSPWAVGHNTAGYLPESDVALFIDYADALAYYVSELDEIVDRHWSDDYECTCTDGELCDYHVEEAAIAAHKRDDIGGATSELSYVATPGHESLATVYWLQRGEVMTYADYLAAADA